MAVPKRGKVKRDKPNGMEVENYEYHQVKQVGDWTHANRNRKAAKAAKGRRDREGEELNRLAQLLPISQDVVEHLDKGAILRLAICYLRMKHYTQKDGTALLDELKTRENDDPNMNDGLHLNEADLMLDALNGFLIFISNQGYICYVSPQVYKHIGIKQENMVGRSIADFIHSDDKKELKLQFRQHPPQRNPSLAMGQNHQTTESDVSVPPIGDPARLFYIRIKCQVTRKKTKQTGMMLTQWSGRLRPQPWGSGAAGSNKAILAIVRPMQSSPLIEIRLSGNMFMSRHALDMKFTFCDPRILTLIGYEPSEVIGKTAYQFHNPWDAQKIQNCHSNLIVKGTSISKYYRFLSKTGEWVWMQTRANIVNNSSNQPQYVVCMNYIISKEEGRRYLMMEQEEQGLCHQDIPKAFTDVTTFDFSPCYSSLNNSPGPGNSSGYVSGDDDHNYTRGDVFSETSSLSTDSHPATPLSELSPGPNTESVVFNELFSDGKDGLFDVAPEDIDFKELVDIDASDWLGGLKGSDSDTMVSGCNGLLSNSGSGFSTASTASYMQQALSNGCTDTDLNSMAEMMDIDSGVSIDRCILKELLAESGQRKDVFSEATSTSQGSTISLTTPSNQFSRKCASSRGGRGANHVSRAATQPQFSGMLLQSLSEKLLSTPRSSAHPQNGGTRAQMNISVDAFVPETMDAPMKFAENFVNNQMEENLNNYPSRLDFSGSYNTPITACSEVCSPPVSPAGSSLSLSPMVNGCQSMLGSSPDAYRGGRSAPVSPDKYQSQRIGRCNGHAAISDHTYTSRPMDDKATSNRDSHQKGRSASQQDCRVLEHLLLCKVPLDGQKGSDAVLAANGISQLNLKDKSPSDPSVLDGQLLKKLLTGELGEKEVHKSEASVIEDRKMQLNSPQRQPSPPVLALDTDLPSLGDPQNIGLDHDNDMDKLWNPTSPDPEELMSSELDDILREQLRQDDLWLQHYFNDL